MWNQQRIEFMHWRRVHQWTLRDILCRLGLHWPRQWERSARGDRVADELLCTACRIRIAVRPALLSLAAISMLARPEGEDST